MNQPRPRHFEMRVNAVLLAAARLPVFPPPPLAGPVNGPLPAQLEAVHAVGVDQRRGPSHFQAGDARFNPRVIIGILRALKQPLLLDAQVYSRLQEDRAGQESPFGHYYHPAVRRRATVNRSLNRFGAERPPVSHRPIFGNDEPLLNANDSGRTPRRPGRRRTRLGFHRSRAGPRNPGFLHLHGIDLRAAVEVAAEHNPFAVR